MNQAAAVAALAVLVLLTPGPAPVRAEGPTTRPALAPVLGEPRHLAPGLTYFTVTQADFPLRAHGVEVDLTNPAVRVEMAWGGPDPDGPAGPWETTLMPTSAVARREGFVAAVNAGFFRVPEPGTLGAALAGEDPHGYVAGAWAANVGYHAEEGVVQGGPYGGVLLVTADGRARIGDFPQLPADTREAVSGSQIVLLDGVVTPAATAAPTTRPVMAATISRAGSPSEPVPDPDRPNPRTAVGVADGGRTLILLVADGRQPGHSAGLTLPELAGLMKQLGATDALNLDGGGSSTLVLRDPDQPGQAQVINHPSDRALGDSGPAGRERAVADVLGVRVVSTTRPDRP